MITSSFGLTATERVLPKLTLDFTATPLDSRITFTRTTGASNPATYVNSSGVITTATNDQPRFDYDPMTLVCRGLLIEESRTNLAKYSDQFDNAIWSKTEVSVSNDSVIAPDGTLTADKLVESANSSFHFLLFAQVMGAAAYTLSAYMKAGERTSGSLMLSQGGNVGAVFDLSAGTVISVNGTGNTAEIHNAGNGWYRCVISNNGTADLVDQARIGVKDGVKSSYQGDGTSGIYIWGAQLEAGAFPTSYIPTTTAALTRNADVATITGTNFSDFWQAGKGGVLVRARPGTVSGTRPWVQFDDGTVDNLIAIRGNGTDPELYIVDSTTPQAQIDAGTIAANTDYAMTAWWNTDDCKARLNSGAVVSDSSATIPTVDQMRIGSDGTNYLNGHIASIGYYDRFSSQIYTRRKNKAVFSLL